MIASTNNILASFTLLLSIAAAQNTFCPYGNANYGASIIYGFNQGGCFACEDDSGRLLSGEALVKSCRQMCDNDDECKSFEVGNRALASFYETQSESGEAMNCCLEYDVVASDHPLFIDAREAQYESTDCGKQASCWNSYVKSEYLKDGNALCDQSFVIPAATTGSGLIKGSANRAETYPQCRQVTWVDESILSGFKKFQAINKRMEWFKDGCPLVNGDNYLESLLDDAYQQCLDDIKEEETKNKVIDSSLLFTPRPTDRPTDRPRPRPTQRPTFRPERQPRPTWRPTWRPTEAPRGSTDRPQDEDNTSSSSANVAAKASLTVIAIAFYAML